MSQNQPPFGPPPPPSSPPTSAPGSGPRRSPLAGVSPKILAMVGGGVLALVLLIVVIAVAAGGGGIKSADGDIINADTFLSDATQQWRSELPTSGVKVHDDAGCFYVVDSDGEVTGKIACGGVRRYGTDKGEVWDVASFDTAVTGEDEVTASDLAFTEFSVRRPSGDLRDADGDGADDALDDVDEPSLPQATAGLVMDGFDASGSTRTDEIHPGEAGQVRVPGYLITFTSIATVGAIADEDGLYAPAAGETFRIFDYTAEPTDSTDGPSVGTKVVLDSNGTKTDVTEVSSQGGTFLVSAAEGAMLIVTADGHEQKVDPFDGKRQPDPVTDVYYRTGTDQDINKSLHWPDKSGAFAGDDYTLALASTVPTASLTPYLPSDLETGSAGWAPEGSAWLVIEVDADMADNTDCCSIGPKKTTQAWTATIDAKAYRSSKSLVLDSGWGATTHYVAIQVPSSTTTADISVAATTVIENYGSGTRNVDHGSQSFTVNFK